MLNFGARVVFGRRKFDHVSDLWTRLGWLRPQQLVDLSTLNIAHKIIRSGKPDALAAIFNLTMRKGNVTLGRTTCMLFLGVKRRLANVDFV